VSVRIQETKSGREIEGKPRYISVKTSIYSGISPIKARKNQKKFPRALFSPQLPSPVSKKGSDRRGDTRVFSDNILDFLPKI
jgi:hypothetical protein